MDIYNMLLQFNMQAKINSIPMRTAAIYIHILVRTVCVCNFVEFLQTTLEILPSLIKYFMQKKIVA